MEDIDPVEPIDLQTFRGHAVGRVSPFAGDQDYARMSDAVPDHFGTDAN